MTPGPIAIVVAHPDDESVGVGGQLDRLTGAIIVLVTNGAPDNFIGAQRAGFSTDAAYAQARRHEFQSAMAAAGIPQRNLVALGIKDQEVAYCIPDLATRLAGQFVAHQIEMVLTHAFEGGHPDHDATSFAVQAACILLKRAGRCPPLIIEMPFYHRDSGMDVYQLFRCSDGVRETRIALTYRQRSRKRRLLDFYVSQSVPLAHFSVCEEAFRLAPRHDFRSPPGDGSTYYEEYRLGMTREEWHKTAAAAAKELSIRLTP